MASHFRDDHRVVPAVSEGRRLGRHSASHASGETVLGHDLPFVNGRLRAVH
jgi:hypothetical protein